MNWTEQNKEKVMNKIYKASDIYLVQLGIIQDPEKLGIGKASKVWKTMPEIYFAKKIVSEGGQEAFKILTKKIKVYDTLSNKSAEDYVIAKKSPLNDALRTNYKFVTYKAMAKAEELMNSKDNEIKPKFCKTKDGLELI